MLGDRHRLFLTEGLEAVFGRVNEVFFDIADANSEVKLQTLYFDAMKILRSQRDRIQAEMLERVVEGFGLLMTATADDHDENGRVSDTAKGSDAEVSLDNLALVEHDELEAIIAMDTMVSVARTQVYARLRQLTGRLTSVLGRVPAAATLPFEPEYLVNCFDGCSRQLAIGLEPRLSLLNLFAEVVLASLPNFLEECDELLEGLGIEPTYIDESMLDDSMADDSTADTAVDDGSGNKSPEQLETLTSAPPLVGVESAQHILSRASHRLLAELPESVKAQVAGIPLDTQYPPLSIAVTTLLQLGDGEAANTEPFGVREHRSIREQIETEMIRQGQSFEELHPVDQHIVGLMDAVFVQMGQHKWSPDVLSGLLGKAELPAVNLAVSDSHFLDREHHPARRLLNEIAAVASSFQVDSQPAIDPLYQTINEVLGRLGRMQSDTRQLTELLSEFIEDVETDRRRCARLGARTMEKVLASELTNSAYQQVEKTLKSRVCGAALPLFVLDLVEQAWCKVLFLACVKHGVESREWHAGVHLLDQLIGLVADPDSADTAYVEKLVAALAEALEHIAYDSFEASKLLRWVTDFFVTDHRGASLVVLEKDEARDAKQYFAPVTTDVLDLAIPGEPPPMEDELVGKLEDSDLSRVDSIAQESWVEFRSISGEPVCGRLLGVVPSSNKFIFGDRAGNKIAEAHRYRLAVAMKEGNLVVLDNSHLFDTALREAFSVMREKAVNEA